MGCLLSIFKAQIVPFCLPLAEMAICLYTFADSKGAQASL